MNYFQGAPPRKAHFCEIRLVARHVKKIFLCIFNVTQPAIMNFEEMGFLCPAGRSPLRDKATCSILSKCFTSTFLNQKPRAGFTLDIQKAPVKDLRRTIMAEIYQRKVDDRGSLYTKKAIPTSVMP